MLSLRIRVRLVCRISEALVARHGVRFRLHFSMALVVDCILSCRYVRVVLLSVVAAVLTSRSCTLVRKSMSRFTLHIDQ